jgi:hypothetical protein
MNVYISRKFHHYKWWKSNYKGELWFCFVQRELSQHYLVFFPEILSGFFEVVVTDVGQVVEDGQVVGVVGSSNVNTDKRHFRMNRRILEMMTFWKSSQPTLSRKGKLFLWSENWSELVEVFLEDRNRVGIQTHVNQSSFLVRFPNLRIQYVCISS